MILHTRILLIGYRGTGKTTVGRLLAAELGWPFLDADDVLVAQAGRTIADIFRESGESTFRDLEEQTLTLLCKQSPLVLATGGGVILRAQNRERLRTAGFVVWLQAPAEELWQRLQADPRTAVQRPNLAQGGLSEIQQLLVQREPLYRETAAFSLSTVGKSPETLASAILSEWRALAAKQPPPSTV